MKHVSKVILLFFFIACSTDATDRNPFLQEINFRFDINTNLPLYNNLNTIGNPIYIGNPGVGTRGVFVMKTSLDTFFAFEASCPNHVPNNCSTMEIDGQNVVCPCEGFTYNLFTGQQLDRPNDGNRYHDLLFYSARQSGNIVTVSN